ncbi:Predicted PurR-regulated permease PerM [Brevibacterium iodinum ATCC 49514]|uniref:Predicted PurR-regulated permease PerM n=1 Tax=Brevibacterium iodinum ATCC 49514 TaxID=1255616 RepID=A0A2H1JBK7_9MICO|nr:AI-2E family transporter [Brevibacterium iodinum]SMX84876.1 Predicted PurR-regulated permease PerM [Brevibacterium iodinum ATCC 49514]SUW12859.1 pheromone autoinducer 2 transporter [Brevibacterium iodinum]
MDEDEQATASGVADGAAGSAGDAARPAEPAPSSQTAGETSQAFFSAGDWSGTAASATVGSTTSDTTAGTASGTSAGAAADEASGADSGTAGEARPWHARPPARALMIAVTLAGLAYALMFFRGLQDIVAPVFLALNFYIVVYPVQRLLTRIKVPRAIGACISVVLVLCMIFAFFGLTAWSVAELVILIPSYSNELVATYQSTLALLSDIGVTSSVIQQQLSAFDVRSVLDAVYPLLTNLSSVAGLLTTVIMAVFFVAMDSMGIDKRMAMLLDVKPSLSASIGDFASGVRRYWVVATVFGLIVAFLDVIALAIIDVPLIWVWGVLAFLTNYIPNIGFVIGLIPPALLALVDSGWQSALWVVIAYSVLNFVIQAIIQPKFTGESVGVTPLISFLSLLFWVWILGWLGALLALPATLLIKALLVDADPRARWVNILLASDPHTGRAELVKGLKKPVTSA